MNEIVFFIKSIYLINLQAKIMCTSMCKCYGCKNVSPDDVCNSLMHLADAAVVRDRQASQAAAVAASTSIGMSSSRGSLPHSSSSIGSASMNSMESGIPSGCSVNTASSSAEENSITGGGGGGGGTGAGDMVSRVTKSTMNLSNIISTMKDRIKQEQDYDILKFILPHVMSKLSLSTLFLYTFCISIYILSL